MLLVRALWSFSIACAAAGAFAQGQFPAKPVTFVVPYAAGGPTDVVARAVAEKLAGALGQTVIVDNRPGANEAIAAAYVAGAPADGHTVLFATEAALSLNPHLYSKLAYKPETDLVPVTRVAEAQMLLVVPPQTNVNTLADFVRRAKQAPQSVSYASAGLGNTTHLSMEWFSNLAGIKLAHVPYKGISPALPDLMADRVSAMFSGASAVLPHIKDGKLRALATSGARRSSALPNVPTFAESGYPSFEATFYLGVVAPKATPSDIVARLAAEISKVVRDPAFRARAQELWGLDMVGETPAEFAEFLKRDRASAVSRVKVSGARLD